MQTYDQKVSEMDKLNKAQRSAMRFLWGANKIDAIFVEDVLDNNYPTVKVRNPKHIWLIVNLGPRGGVHGKRWCKL